MKTMADVRKAREIIQRLEELGIPLDVISNLNRWVARRAKKIIDSEILPNPVGSGGDS